MVDDQQVQKLLSDVTAAAKRSDASMYEEAAREDNAGMDQPSREEMRHAIDAGKSETTAIAERLRADFAGLRAEFAELRGEMRSGFEALRGQMHKNTADTIKWTVGILISIIALAVAILTFVINNAQRKEASPITINVPAAPASTAPPASAPAK